MSDDGLKLRTCPQACRDAARNTWLRLRHGRQWWYWTPQWQAMEREADEDLAAGRFTQYNTMEEALRDLDERLAPTKDELGREEQDG